MPAISVIPRRLAKSKAAFTIRLFCLSPGQLAAAH